MRYFDTSLFFSLCVSDDFSQKTKVEAQKDKGEIALSDWMAVELKSALAQRVSLKVLVLKQAEQVWKKFREDVSQGHYSVLDSDSGILQRATIFLPLAGQVRVADALHVAFAQAYALDFVTADDIQAKAAKSANLKVTLLKP